MIKFKGSNPLAVAMRQMANEERAREEVRLLERAARQARVAGGNDSAASTGGETNPPGTPGSVAPDESGFNKGDKSMSKKELKRSQNLKTAEATSQANQNLNNSLFSNMGRAGSLFGKKGKAKTYDWMNTAKSSGGSVAGRASGGGGVAGAAGDNSKPAALTVEGRNRMGTRREDGPQGHGIQMNDWIVALETDGNARDTLQLAYAFRD